MFVVSHHSLRSIALQRYARFTNYGKKKTEQILREQKRMKMLTDLHKIYSECSVEYFSRFHVFTEVTSFFDCQRWYLS